MTDDGPPPDPGSDAGGPWPTGQQWPTDHTRDPAWPPVVTRPPRDWAEIGYRVIMWLVLAGIVATFIMAAYVSCTAPETARRAVR